MNTSLAYIPRIADKMLQEQLEAAGVVLIQGPKWCGKTTTAVQQAKSVSEMPPYDKLLTTSMQLFTAIFPV